MKNLLGLLFSLILFGLNSQSFADKMDSETQSQVIDRLEHVLSLMEPKESSRPATETRLADLLAERARLRYMNEMDKNCTKACPGSKADRTRSIALYKKVLNQTQKADQGRILFQLAHLYLMAGKPEKSTELYLQILRAPAKRYTAELVGLAHSSLADLYFETGKFEKALQLYQKAFRIEATPGRGLILYRIAWSQFNLEKNREGTQSLEKLLASPQLLTKTAEKDAPQDEAFRGDVLRDLATFYSKQKVTDKEIGHFNEMLAQDNRKEMLLFFAGEADRLGQKQAAAKIYNLYLLDKTLTKEERLDATVHLAQTNYDGGNSARATEEFAQAALAFKKVKCSENAQCMDLKKRMRHYVTELHRSKKTKPDMEVLKAYVSYSQAFQDDAEMAVLGAQIAMDLKQQSTAFELYDRASNTPSKFQDAAVDGEIEAAEQSNDAQLRRRAYSHALEVRPKNQKNFQIRYQLAHLSYDEKNWKKAAEEFRTLALDKSGEPNLRKQSADLALDSLAVLKSDSEIEVWALMFAHAFPSQRVEYEKISRKAVANQIASTANDSKASQSDLSAALRKLQQTPINSASDPEKLLHLRNQLILADKLHDEGALLLTIRQMLAVKSLSSDERENALARAVFVFERKLDFAQAYKTALQMKFSGRSLADKEFRLGTLADLSNKFSPEKHYRAALQAGLKKDAALTVRTRLVELSRSPYSELKTQAPYLSQDAKSFSDLVVQTYAKNPNQKQILDFFKSSRLAQTPAGLFIRKQPFYSQTSALGQKVRSLRFRSNSNAQIQISIAQRVKALKLIDAQLSQALALKDFTAQIMSLQLVKVENERIAQEILALPIPRGLAPNEQIQYRSLIQNKTTPFMNKSRIAAEKIAQLWADPSACDALIQTHNNSRPALKPFWAREMRILQSLAPSAKIQSELADSLHQRTHTAAELQAAREAVRENPSNVTDIEKLKILETKIGHPLAPAYLNARLDRIQKEKTL